MSSSEPLFLNRELSWLAFNQRVLAEAQDPATPLLERLKFLAITASNLDEFFMVRVGGLQQLQQQGNNGPDPAGLATDEQLARISWITHQMAADQQACLREIGAALTEKGIRPLAVADLGPAQLEYVRQVFDREIFPLLTPLAVPSPRAFPLVPSLAVCLAVNLETPRARGRRKHRFAVVPMPRNLNRFVNVEIEKGTAFVLVEDVVRAHLDRFFPGERVIETVMFRITRNADMAVREDLAGDLLSQMRRVLTQRRGSDCVRLELTSGASSECRTFLKEAANTPARCLYEIEGPMALSSYLTLSLTIGDESLRDKPWEPRPLPGLTPPETVFSAIARHDILICHPFESFEPVQRLIEQAADDPDVLAIKQILYRTSRRSPIVAALARAAERGKHVTAIVELKARFDEARNIEWADALERSGVQVIHGIKGLKTHAKICLIVRREATGIRRYVHFGTGNYNEITARLYTDVSLMTCNEDLAADASLFFNTITGHSQPAKYSKLEAAPIGLRDRIIELIEAEALRATEGQQGHIMAKMNSLVDPAIIEALYAASKAGVTIELNVRGVCCLRPGVPGLSDHISVVSIVDRFLEHSRIFHFHNGGAPQVFISSADWMPRNLDRRIELLIPVEDEACRRKLVGILKACLAATVKAWDLAADGNYVRRAAAPEKAVWSQKRLCSEAVDREMESARQQPAVFQPLRPKAEE